MRIKIKLLPGDDIYLGVRFTITKLVKDLASYSPEETYPKAYNLDIGFLFGSIELMFTKGSN